MYLLFIFAASNNNKTMKKVLLLLSLVVVTSSVFTGCSKDDDTEAPVVTILGDNPYKLAVGSSFDASNDPGATASDNEDGNLTSSINKDYSELDLANAGEYEVHYEVRDNAGNFSDNHRIMYVTHIGTQITGSWNIVEKIGTTVQSSAAFNTNTVSDTYAFSVLGLSDGGQDNAAEIKMEADRLTMAEQNLYAATSSFKIYGNGTIKKNASNKLEITLTYSVKDSVTNLVEDYTAVATKL
jgi:hypothetical protein